MKSKTERAWLLVKDVLEDEEAYLTLKQGFPIPVTGSKGNIYVLYPSGKFIKANKKKAEAEIGSIVNTGEFASPDYLATIIAWIKHNEAKLEKDWRCGNFSIRTGIRHRREDTINKVCSHYAYYLNGHHNYRGRPPNIKFKSTVRNGY